MADVLIFEDCNDEIAKIVKWLGLEEGDFAVSPVFDMEAERHIGPNAGAAAGYRRVEADVRHSRPRVVVLDYLLTGIEGNMPFDGLAYGTQLKEQWPDLGVIIVTTGGPVIGSQEMLNEQKQLHGWPIDYAWIKNWSEEAMGAYEDTVVQPMIEALIAQSIRPE